LESFKTPQVELRAEQQTQQTAAAMKALSSLLGGGQAPGAEVGADPCMGVF
jgi:hypothetical protein